MKSYCNDSGFNILSSTYAIRLTDAVTHWCPHFASNLTKSISLLIELCVQYRDGRPSRGFDCYLQEIEYVNNLPARLYPVVATQNSHLFLSDLFDDRDNMWESPLMNVLVEQIDQQEIDQHIRRRNSDNALKLNMFERKKACLDYDFHV